MDVNRKLNSIGKAVFISFYDEFKKYSKTDMLELLINEKISINEAGAMRRIVSAKQIFKANEQIKALNMCISAKKITSNLVKRARELREFELNN